MRFAFRFVFAILGLAIAYSVAADQAPSAKLWLGAALGYLGVVWLAIVTA
jgi:uncharacterized membrane protein YagU involved in acid resistance